MSNNRRKHIKRGFECLRSTCKVVCKICAKEFESSAAKAYYCPICKPFVYRVVGRIRNRGEKPIYDQDFFDEVLRVRNGEAKESLRDAHHCPRCGEMTTRKDYCLTCKRSGLYRVHEATGRTTGWDRKTYGVARVSEGDARLTKGLTLKRTILNVVE